MPPRWFGLNEECLDPRQIKRDAIKCHVVASGETERSSAGTQLGEGSPAVSVR